MHCAHAGVFGFNCSETSASEAETVHFPQLPWRVFGGGTEAWWAWRGWIDPSVSLHWWDAADLRVPVPTLLHCSHCWRHSGFSGFKGDGPPRQRRTREAALSQGPWVVYPKPFNSPPPPPPPSPAVALWQLWRRTWVAAPPCPRLLCRWPGNLRLRVDVRSGLRLAPVSAFHALSLRLKSQSLTSASAQD